MQDGTTRLPADGQSAASLEPDDAEADVHLRHRIRTLTAAARELSDACADLADALRPLPGNGMDDPLTMDFSRLAAERTAALLDEAASVTRGTLGLLGSAYDALDANGAPPGGQPAGAEPGQPADAHPGQSGQPGRPAEPGQPGQSGQPAEPGQPSSFEQPAGRTTGQHRAVAAAQPSPPAQLRPVAASAPPDHRPPDHRPPDAGRPSPFRPTPAEPPAQFGPPAAAPGQPWPAATDPNPLRPATTDPGQPWPAATDPGQLRPAATDPSPLRPAATDPGQPWPAASDPSPLRPATSNPSPLRPAASDPGRLRPATGDPGRAWPAATDPSPPRPAASDPSPLRPVASDPGRFRSAGGSSSQLTPAASDLGQPRSAADSVNQLPPAEAAAGRFRPDASDPDPLRSPPAELGQFPPPTQPSGYPRPVPAPAEPYEPMPAPDRFRLPPAELTAEPAPSRFAPPTPSSAPHRFHDAAEPISGSTANNEPGRYGHLAAGSAPDQLGSAPDEPSGGRDPYVPQSGFPGRDAPPIERGPFEPPAAPISGPAPDGLRLPPGRPLVWPPAGPPAGADHNANQFHQPAPRPTAAAGPDRYGAADPLRSIPAEGPDRTRSPGTTAGPGGPGSTGSADGTARYQLDPSGTGQFPVGTGPTADRFRTPMTETNGGQDREASRFQPFGPSAGRPPIAGDPQRSQPPGDPTAPADRWPPAGPEQFPPPATGPGRRLPPTSTTPALDPLQASSPGQPPTGPGTGTTPAADPTRGTGQTPAAGPIRDRFQPPADSSGGGGGGGSVVPPDRFRPIADDSDGLSPGQLHLPTTRAGHLPAAGAPADRFRPPASAPADHFRTPATSPPDRLQTPDSPATDHFRPPTGAPADRFRPPDGPATGPTSAVDPAHDRFQPTERPAGEGGDQPTGTSRPDETGRLSSAPTPINGAAEHFRPPVRPINGPNPSGPPTGPNTGSAAFPGTTASRYESPGAGMSEHGMSEQPRPATGPLSPGPASQDPAAPASRDIGPVPAGWPAPDRFQPTSGPTGPVPDGHQAPDGTRSERLRSVPDPTLDTFRSPARPNASTPHGAHTDRYQQFTRPTDGTRPQPPAGPGSDPLHPAAGTNSDPTPERYQQFPRPTDHTRPQPPAGPGSDPLQPAAGTGGGPATGSVPDLFQPPAGSTAKAGGTPATGEAGSTAATGWTPGTGSAAEARSGGAEQFRAPAGPAQRFRTDPAMDFLQPAGGRPPGRAMDGRPMEAPPPDAGPSGARPPDVDAGPERSGAAEVDRPAPEATAGRPVRPQLRSVATDAPTGDEAESRPASRTGWELPGTSTATSRRLPALPPLPPLPEPRSESTWPDAFVKAPPRADRTPPPMPLDEPEPGRHGTPVPELYEVEPDDDDGLGMVLSTEPAPADAEPDEPAPDGSALSRSALIESAPPAPASPAPASPMPASPVPATPLPPGDRAPVWSTDPVAFPVDEPDRFAEYLLAPSPPSLPAANGIAPSPLPPARQIVPDPLTDPLPTLLGQPAATELPAAPDLPVAAPEEYGSALPSTPGPADPDDHSGLAVLARQVEAARRHLQAAVVVAHDQSHPVVGDLLGVVEQVLASLTELASGSREALPAAIASQVFPGEARFLCSMPWERNPVVADDPHGPEPAGSSGLCRLLLALGYEAQLVTGSAGASSVQIRTDRYAAHIALVEPAGGGRQRWSGALEWTDANGVTRTWAETLGPVELDEEELARRTDELLRRCVGSRC